MPCLSEKLNNSKKLPAITAYNRIDGPGSSLDLRLFQQAFAKIAPQENPPRTVAMTINIGSKITAHPLPPGKVGVESLDFGFSYVFDKNDIPPIKELWLLKIIDAFDLDGVKFVIKNTHPDIKSAGLGGSATVTMGTAMLADSLSYSHLHKVQMIGMASLIEQDWGVSLTGTQEQANVVFGGVRDYRWLPWGREGYSGGYGSLLQEEILSPDDYYKLEKRIALFFVKQRLSTDVNQVWYDKLRTQTGYRLHRKKCKLSRQYTEGIKNQDWEALVKPINKYREIRTKLCPNYMTDEAKKIQKICNKVDGASFPLGGGGGTVMVYHPNPEQLKELKHKISSSNNTLIDYKILKKGHKFHNV